MECNLGDITLHYNTFGMGRSLLFLHGGRGDHQPWLPVIESLFEQRTGWKRIYLDLPGHGLTRAPDWMNTADDVLDVLVRFIDLEIPGERFVVGGFSYGAYLAQGILYRRFSDIDGLLLIAPAMHTEGEPKPARTILVRDTSLLIGLDELLKNIAEGLLVVQTPGTIEKLRINMRRVVHSATPDDENFNSRIQPSLSSDIDKLPEAFDKPTLFLLGRQDHLVGYRDAWKVIENYPRASFVVLDGAGHGVALFEQYQVCQVLMSDWIDHIELGLHT